MYDSPEELLGKIRLGEDTPLELKAVDFRGQRVHEPARDDLADEIAAIEMFVRSAAIGCINVPPGAGKMEIPDKGLGCIKGLGRDVQNGNPGSRNPPACRGSARFDR